MYIEKHGRVTKAEQWELAVQGEEEEEGVGEMIDVHRIPVRLALVYRERRCVCLHILLSHSSLNGTTFEITSLSTSINPSGMTFTNCNCFSLSGGVRSVTLSSSS